MRDLEELADYIGEESKQAAELVETRVREAAALLSRFPRSGRTGLISRTREKAVGRTPYILVYQVDSVRIRILRIYHGARKWPSNF
jgi:addiction module RelE/StbE family toxin